jgi:hypothetical protein
MASQVRAMNHFRYHCLCMVLVDAQPLYHYASRGVKWEAWPLRIQYATCGLSAKAVTDPEIMLGAASISQEYAPTDILNLV